MSVMPHRTSTAANLCQDNPMAFVMAKKFIEQRLKAPSTAKFPNMSDDGVVITPATVTGGKCGFIVDTYVDAENGFGANIRARYTVTVAPTERDTFELIHFEEH